MPVYDSPVGDASDLSLNSQLTWSDRSGKKSGLVGAPGWLARATISVNGTVATTPAFSQKAVQDRLSEKAEGRALSSDD